jgi:predicted dienelactone hydrolase
MKICCRLLVSVIFFVAASLACHAASTYEAGIRAFTTAAPERAAAIDLTLWYPSKADGVPELWGESKIFKGVPGRRDASFADGAFPVVVLAGGGLRANPHMTGWIAAQLAMHGHLVIVAHPPVLGPQDAQAAVSEIWLRPSDLSAALGAIENDPVLASHAEPKKVAALGFFLGGTSSLAVAGARLDAERYSQSCDPPREGPDCRWFEKNGVDLHAIDGEKIAASHLDPRIKVAIAINPELSDSLAPDSLGKIAIPVQVINLGKPGEIPGLDASILETLIPGVAYAAIAEATPFSAFSECTPKAAAILAEEGEDATICSDGGSRLRTEIHAEIGRLIETMLAKAFGTP